MGKSSINGGFSSTPCLITRGYSMRNKQMFWGRSLHRSDGWRSRNSMRLTQWGMVQPGYFTTDRLADYDRPLSIKSHQNPSKSFKILQNPSKSIKIHNVQLRSWIKKCLGCQVSLAFASRFHDFLEEVGSGAWEVRNSASSFDCRDRVTVSGEKLLKLYGEERTRFQGSGCL